MGIVRTNISRPIRIAMSFRALSRFLILTLAGLLSACAGVSPVSMKEADRAAIKTVAVEPTVTLPENMFYQSRGQALAGAIAGPVGALAASGASSEPKAVLLNLMKANDISVQQIVKAEFARAANARSRMTFSEGAGQPDASVTLTVNAYGFLPSPMFGAQMYPMLNVSAVMKRPDGTLVWQRTRVISTLHGDNDKAYTYEEYVKNPELLREVWVRVADVLSRVLAGDMES